MKADQDWEQGGAAFPDVAFQIAEGAVPRELFRAILKDITTSKLATAAPGWMQTLLNQPKTIEVVYSHEAEKRFKKREWHRNSSTPKKPMADWEND